MRIDLQSALTYSGCTIRQEIMLAKKLTAQIFNVVQSTTQIKLLVFFQENPQALDNIEGLSIWLGERPEVIRSEIEALVDVKAVNQIGEGEDATYQLSKDKDLRGAIKIFLIEKATRKAYIDGLNKKCTESQSAGKQPPSSSSLPDMDLLLDVATALNAKLPLEKQLAGVSKSLSSSKYFKESALLIRKEILNGDNFNKEEIKINSPMEIFASNKRIEIVPSLEIPIDLLKDISDLKSNHSFSRSTIDYPYVKLPVFLDLILGPGDSDDHFGVVPIMVGDLSCGLLIIGLKKRTLDKKHIKLLNTVARQIGTVMSYIKLVERTKQEHGKFISIMENIDEGIFVINREGLITTFNDTCETMFGMSSQLALGMDFRHAMGDLFNSRIISSLERALATGNRVEEIEVPYLTSWGKEMRVNLRASPFRETGEIMGAVIRLEDVTDEIKRKSALYRILPRHVADQALDTPDALAVQGQRVEITLLIVDVQGFTRLSEQLKPEEVVELINDFIKCATEAIFHYDGTVNKLLGDGVLAFFGAPESHNDDPLRAVKAAIDVQRRIAEFNADRGLTGNKEITVGVGVNTGEVVVGYIGSEQTLIGYDVIGDAVNVADRLEKVALRSQIVISRSTYEFVCDSVVVTGLGPIFIKGRQEPVHAYTVEGLI